MNEVGLCTTCVLVRVPSCSGQGARSFDSEMRHIRGWVRVRGSSLVFMGASSRPMLSSIIQNRTVNTRWPRSKAVQHVLMSFESCRCRRLMGRVGTRDRVTRVDTDDSWLQMDRPCTAQLSQGQKQGYEIAQWAEEAATRAKQWNKGQGM